MISKTKAFTNNHRQNYQNYSKSHIFDPPDSDKKKEVAKQKKETKSMFIPLYKDQTPQERLLKELWNKEEYVKDKSKKETSIGFCEREINRFERKKHMQILLTPKDRKLLDLNPTMKLEQVTAMRRAKSFYEKRTVDKEEFTDLRKSAKNKKVESLLSNIFYDPNKPNLTVLFVENEETNSKQTEQVKKKENNQQQKHNTKLSTNMNWSKVNAELIGNKKNNQNEKYSASIKKRENMISDFDSEDTKKLALKDNKPKTEENKDNEKIKVEIASHYGNGNKSKVMYNLASSLDSRNLQDFCGNYQSQRETETIELEAREGFDKLEASVIKRLFTSQGIHVYHLEENGTYLEGFKSGKIALKIRKRPNDETYVKKLNDISENVKKLGLRIKKVETSKPKRTQTPGRGLLKPVSNMIVEKPKPLPPNERFSNYHQQADTSYKNPYSRNAPQKIGLNRSKSSRKI